MGKVSELLKVWNNWIALIFARKCIGKQSNFHVLRKKKGNVQVKIWVPIRKCQAASTPCKKLLGITI